MKTNILLLISMLLTAVAICSCNNDDADESAPTKFEFKPPYTKWHCDINEVRTYMKSVGTFIELDPVPYVNCSTSYSFYNQKNISYSYEIGKDGLVQSTVGYNNANENFDEFFNSITTQYAITHWEDIHYANDTETWGVIGSNKDTSIRVGRSDSHNAMFASFMCLDHNVSANSMP